MLAFRRGGGASSDDELLSVQHGYMLLLGYLKFSDALQSSSV